MGTNIPNELEREAARASGTPRTGPRRGGQVLIIFAFAILVLGALCVFAIDFGHLFVVKAQLQNAVDAAAIAGAAKIPTGLIDADDKAVIAAEVRGLAGANIVNGAPLQLDDTDIQFGHYDDTTKSFVPEAQTTVIDSVQIRGRLTHDSPNGAVDLFFGPIFGWNEVEFKSLVAVGTKPRRYVMFVLDRSGSMCFDTGNVIAKSHTVSLPGNDTTGYFLENSPSGWYWLPETSRRKSGSTWYTQTAWFYAVDINTGQVVTDFLPDHIKARLVSGMYFNFRSVDSPDTVDSGWIKVPSGVRIYSRYISPWIYTYTTGYQSVVPNPCAYAVTTPQVDPIQTSVDAACAFTDLLDTEDDMAGLVSYATKANLDQPLTANFGEVKRRIRQMIPAGSTAEPDGMKKANDEIITSGRAEAYGHRLMILLTDGNANYYNGNSYDNNTHTFTFLGQSVTCKIHPTVGGAMATQTTRAASDGIRIYCISFGADADQVLHQRIAAATHGVFYYAESEEHLVDIFVDIFRRLPPVITK